MLSVSFPKSQKAFPETLNSFSVIPNKPQNISQTLNPISVILNKSKSISRNALCFSVSFPTSQKAFSPKKRLLFLGKSYSMRQAMKQSFPQTHTFVSEQVVPNKPESMTYVELLVRFANGTSSRVSQKIMVPKPRAL